jgi:hypothetical protein
MWSLMLLLSQTQQLWREQTLAHSLVRVNSLKLHSCLNSSSNRSQLQQQQPQEPPVQPALRVKHMKGPLLLLLLGP